MTTSPRSLVTPRLDAQVFASRATARASHPAALAELATDAAGGHVGQRWTLGRIETGVYSWFFESATNGKFLDVLTTVALKGGTWSASDAVTVTLTITDGTTTASSSTYVPDGLRGDRDLSPAPTSGVTPRLWSATQHRWTLDLDAIRATLTASTLWRLTIDVAADATVYLEHWQVTEVPRFLVDSADAYGQPPHHYLPRGIVRNGATGLPRIGATLEAAFDTSLRTYHARAVAEAAPLTTTSASYGSLAGDDEPGGAACSWIVRPRRMRGDTQARVRFRCRYKTSGASGGDLKLASGVSSYTVTLTATSGAWADCTATTAYLLTSGADYVDTLTWRAKVAAGTLSISTLTVWDYPT